MSNFFGHVSYNSPGGFYQGPQGGFLNENKNHEGFTQIPQGQFSNWNQTQGGFYGQQNFASPSSGGFSNGNFSHGVNFSHGGNFPPPQIIFSQGTNPPQSNLSQLGYPPQGNFSQCGNFSRGGPPHQSNFSQVGFPPQSDFSRGGPATQSYFSQGGPPPQSNFSRVGSPPQGANFSQSENFGQGGNFPQGGPHPQSIFSQFGNFSQGGNLAQVGNFSHAGNFPQGGPHPQSIFSKTEPHPQGSFSQDGNFSQSRNFNTTVGGLGCQKTFSGESWMSQSSEISEVKTNPTPKKRLVFKEIPLAIFGPPFVHRDLDSFMSEVGKAYDVAEFFYPFWDWEEKDFESSYVASFPEPVRGIPTEDKSMPLSNFESRGDASVANTGEGSLQHSDAEFILQINDQQQIFEWSPIEQENLNVNLAFRFVGTTLSRKGKLRRDNMIFDDFKDAVTDVKLSELKLNIICERKRPKNPRFLFFDENSERSLYSSPSGETFPVSKFLERKTLK